jgi:large subunit ribosomal protein L4
MVVDVKTPELTRATKNVQSTLLVRADYLSVFHILNADAIIMTPKAVDVVEKWLGKESK